MKRISYMIITVLTMFIFNIFVNAASANLSVSSNSVYVGDTFTISVNMASSAAWNIHVSSSGPVSGCIINQADATADALDTNKTFTANCTATSEGVITISLSGDVTSSLDGNAVGISGSNTVSVSKKPDVPTPTPNPQPSNNTNNNQTNNNEENKEDKSTNNNLKELSIDGYELTKVDNNNYTLSVSNDVTSINVKATAEDDKAKIDGIGKHELNIGENNIELIVTSESGNQNKINIKVTRKDGYYLEDLDNVLKSNDKNISINVNKDSKLSSQDLTKIKESKKIVKLNYYDNNKKLIYSFILDGTKINDFETLTTDISFESSNKDKIYKLSNYADGMYIEILTKGIIPKGTKVKIYVKDKYKDNDLLNVYYYSKEDNKLLDNSKSLKVKDGYIEFDISNNGDYFITMSNIDTTGKVVVNKNSNSKGIIVVVFLIIIVIALISMFIVYIVIRKKNKDREVKDEMKYVKSINSDTITNQNISNNINSNPNINCYNNPTYVDDNNNDQFKY